uniref:ABI family, member 3 (NESH) binding protein b n=1 Tax=Salarias fasciatus TaxID=181472 RepID=A0A672GR33_SALFA
PCWCLLYSLSFLLLLTAVLLAHPQRGRRRQSLKVRINATDDTIVMTFVRPSADVKLEGYILGYGGGVFSKQFIPLPEDGEPYQAEMDAEPKYLIAVQPIPTNDVKKHCTGKVNLEKPLHLVIGSVSPTAVLLSWGNMAKTPYEGNILDECLEDGFYTIRYRERNRKWIYQTCPTSDTVVDNLKPNTPYEFGVRSNKDENSGTWSKPVVHNTNMGSKKNGLLPFTFFFLVQGHLNPVQGSERTCPLGSECPAQDEDTHHSPDTSSIPPLAPDTENLVRSAPHLPEDPPIAPWFQATQAPQTSTTVASRITVSPTSGHSSHGRTTEASIKAPNNPNLPHRQTHQTGAQTDHHHHRRAHAHRYDGPPPHSEAALSLSACFSLCFFLLATRQETWEESDLFKAQPTSDLDALGKKRYVAPHVVYKTGKKPDEPCSITSSLNFFPESEPGETNVTAPPRSPPSNLTVVTVEGCPSFVILDWEKTDNDTTEYEVISTAKGPDGEQVSILTTNQTHTAVENLKPESSYEFKVKPKNELGTGPPSEPVSFNTESADPRVSENVSGKDAIWTQFPFKTDSYSDCHGKQYVKRTWYRKFVGVQLCNSLRYKIYLSDSLNGKFYNIGDQTGFGEDHCQFVDSFLDGRTGRQLQADQLPSRAGFYRAVRQEPVHFGQIGGRSHISYVSWYECGTPIPGKW